MIWRSLDGSHIAEVYRTMDFTKLTGSSADFALYISVTTTYFTHYAEDPSYIGLKNPRTTVAECAPLYIVNPSS